MAIWCGTRLPLQRLFVYLYYPDAPFLIGYNAIAPTTVDLHIPAVVLRLAPTVGHSRPSFTDCAVVLIPVDYQLVDRLPLVATGCCYVVGRYSPLRLLDVWVTHYPGPAYGVTFRYSGYTVVRLAVFHYLPHSPYLLLVVLRRPPNDTVVTPPHRNVVTYTTHNSPQH